NPNATMNELAGADLAGLDRDAARTAAVEKLKALGALVKEEPYENKVGFSERAKVPIEPRLSEQWFLKYPSVRPAQTSVAQRGTDEVFSRALGQGLRSLADQHSGLVHQPATLVGTSRAGVASRSRMVCGANPRDPEGFF